MNRDFETILQHSFYILKRNIYAAFTVFVLFILFVFYSRTSAYLLLSLIKPKMGGVFPVTYLFFGLVMSLLVNIVASIYIVSCENVWAGNKPSFFQILKHVKGNFLNVLLVQVFFSLLIGLGTIFFVIPGIFFALWYNQAYSLALIEGLTSKQSFKESKKMMYGRMIQFLLFFLVLGILYYILKELMTIAHFPWIVLLFLFSCVHVYSLTLYYSIYCFLKHNQK